MALAFVLAGCDEPEPADHIEPTTDEQPAADTAGATAADEGAADQGAADEGEGQAAGPVVQTDSFRLAAEPAESYPSGELGQFAITLAPRGKWHLNQSFPTAVSLSAPTGVELPKDKLAKDDAAEFGKKSARFDVPFTPSEQGEHRLEAEVNFAVCTDETCVPKTKTLAVVLPVK